MLGVYEGSGSPDEALRRYAAWNRSVTSEVSDAFHDLIRAWSNRPCHYPKNVRKSAIAPLLLSALIHCALPSKIALPCDS